MSEITERALEILQETRKLSTVGFDNLKETQTALTKEGYITEIKGDYFALVADKRNILAEIEKITEGEKYITLEQLKELEEIGYTYFENCGAENKGTLYTVYMLDEYANKTDIEICTLILRLENKLKWITLYNQKGYIDTFLEVYTTKEKAIEGAKTIWQGLTKYEQKTTNVIAALANVDDQGNYVDDDADLREVAWDSQELEG